MNPVDKLYASSLLKQREDGVIGTENLMYILEEISDGMYITDGNANTLFLNKAYERISGTKRDLFLGKNMRQILEENLIDDSATLRVLARRKEITMCQRLNNGKSVLITGTPIFDEKDNIVMVATIVRDVTQLNKLREEIDRKQRSINRLKYMTGESDNLVSRSQSMKGVIERARKVSMYDTTVLITGETGVGKDVVAKYIHKIGNRKNKPFMEVNCSAIPASLMESELFGYEAGAFTGASKTGKKGLFQLANTGTVFLDEISEMPLDLQAKLLKVVQNKEVYQVGGQKQIPIDVKIIAATNRNLEDMVKEGRFREDLYYRLNVIPIEIPPLRERKEDIVALIDYFLRNLAKTYGMEKTFTEGAIKYLYDYKWPGNIRQLKNIVERSYVLSGGNYIEEKDLPSSIITGREERDFEQFSNYTLDEAVETLEKRLIKQALENTNTAKEAANLLGLKEYTLTRKRQKYGIYGERKKDDLPKK